LTWILLSAICLGVVRALIRLGWSAADIAGLGAVCFLAVYGSLAILAPIALRRSIWFAADQVYLPLDTASKEDPEAFRTWSQTVIPAMEALGFLVRGYFRPSPDIPHCEVFVTLFENRKSGQTAQLFLVKAQRGIIRRSETVLAFTTEFADQTKLYTTNSRTLANHPRIRVRQGSMSFPDVDDPRRLCAIHQATFSSLRGDATTIKPDLDDPANYLRTEYQQDVARFAESGYYFLDSKRDAYRLTWKGAIMVTWKNLWPFKWIRELLRRSQAARQLRELDLSA
jgi:hypothetical protein